MASQSAPLQQGFQFPGTFQLCAMGLAASALEDALPRLLIDAGVRVDEKKTQYRYSSNKRYVSVTLEFIAPSRFVLEQVQSMIKAHPDVQWVL